MLTTALFSSTASSSVSMLSFDRDIGVWKLYKKYKNGKTQCYAINKPLKSTGWNEQRNKKEFIIVSQNNKEFTISTRPGFAISKKERVITNIMGLKFKLNVETDSFAWTYSNIQDKAMLNSLKKAEENKGMFKVKSYSADNHIVIDHYSSEGTDELLQYMGNICGVGIASGD